MSFEVQMPKRWASLVGQALVYGTLSLFELLFCAPTLRVDKSAPSLIKNLVHHDRTNHIGREVPVYHYVRECANRGLIDVQFIGMAEQPGMGGAIVTSVGELHTWKLKK
jgi:hypothetical protein